MSFTRRTVLKLTAAAAASALMPFRAGAKENTRPNLILMVADDMRWDALGAAGNHIIHTPNLDALARVGAYFPDHFVTTSICPTSRASIYTGLYAQRHGVGNFDTPLSAHDLAHSLPALLRQEGYYTGFVGKWGLGGALPKTLFDIWAGFAGQGDYFERHDANSKHLTDLQTRDALHFLQQAPKDKPFALIIAFKAPHGPFQPQERFKQLYADADFVRAQTDTPQVFGALPAMLQDSYSAARYRDVIATDAQYQAFMRNYYRLIAGIDAAWGTIHQALKQQQRDANTTVCFTSDNGLMAGEHRLFGKWTMHEASIRTPLIIRPAHHHSPLAARGMSLNIDIAPTLLALCGIAAPSTMQGMALTDALGGNPIAREAFYYEHDYTHGGAIRPCEGVRTREWKYVRYTQRKHTSEQLFNLADDPLETKDLTAHKSHATQLNAMRSLCAELKAHAA